MIRGEPAGPCSTRWDESIWIGLRSTRTSRASDSALVSEERTLQRGARFRAAAAAETSGSRGGTSFPGKVLGGGGKSHRIRRIQVGRGGSGVVRFLQGSKVRGREIVSEREQQRGKKGEVKGGAGVESHVHARTRARGSPRVAPGGSARSRCSGMAQVAVDEVAEAGDEAARSSHMAALRELERRLGWIGWI